jgi:hypothetical protein
MNVSCLVFNVYAENLFVVIFLFSYFHIEMLKYLLISCYSSRTSLVFSDVDGVGSYNWGGAGGYSYAALLVVPGNVCIYCWHFFLMFFV